MDHWGGDIAEIQVNGVFPGVVGLPPGAPNAGQAVEGHREGLIVCQPVSFLLEAARGFRRILRSQGFGDIAFVLLRQ